MIFYRQANKSINPQDNKRIDMTVNTGRKALNNLSQYVASLGFLHDHQTGIDVVILCVLQLHSTVINCRQDERQLH